MPEGCNDDYGKERCIRFYVLRERRKTKDKRLRIKNYVFCSNEFEPTGLYIVRQDMNCRCEFIRTEMIGFRFCVLCFMDYIRSKQ